MANEHRTNDQGSRDQGAGDRGPRDQGSQDRDQSERASGDRSTAGVNQRIQRASTGLTKAVSGREDVIRAQAARAAKRLDEKTAGRHHEKLRVALHVLDFVVDRFGSPDPDSRKSARLFEPGTPRGEGRSASAEGTKPQPPRDEPEDLGEFTVRESRR